MSYEVEEIECVGGPADGKRVTVSPLNNSTMTIDGHRYSLEYAPLGANGQLRNPRLFLCHRGRADAS